MQIEFFEPLGPRAKELVAMVEESSGQEINVTPWPGGIGPMGVRETSMGATSGGGQLNIHYDPEAGTHERGFVHELLHLKRHVVDGHPTLSLASGISRADLPAIVSIDNEIEHFNIIRLEANHTDDDSDYWLRNSQSNWAAFPWESENLSAWHRRRRTIGHWMLARLIGDLESEVVGRSALEQLGVWREARRYWSRLNQYPAKSLQAAAAAEAYGWPRNQLALYSCGGQTISVPTP